MLRPLRTFERIADDDFDLLAFAQQLPGHYPSDSTRDSCDDEHACPPLLTAFMGTPYRGSVHGCKSVGRDTVGAGIEFAASCQGGDFLTDSLGGQCGIEALQEAVERNSFALGMCGSRRVSQSRARVEPRHCRDESYAELLTVGFLRCESRHEQDGRLCSGVAAADRGTLKCGAAGDSNHHAPRIQGSQQRLACPVEYVADVDLPVAAKRLPTVFVQRPKQRVRTCVDQGDC